MINTVMILPSEEMKGCKKTGQPWVQMSRQIDPHQILRSSTHAQHVALNRLPILRNITRPHYSLGEYQVVLSVFYAVYQQIERALLNFFCARQYAFDYSSRIKLPWLEADLRFLQQSFPGDFSSREFTVPAFEFTRLGEILGALYVIEGSTLGGQVISSSISKHSNLIPAKGGRFYHGYGEATSEKWAEFLIFLKTSAQQKEVMDLAVSSANRVFQQFIISLERNEK